MSLTGNVEGKTIQGNIKTLKKLHGYSAYEIAVINGFSGTEEEWLASLKGEVGKDAVVDQTYYAESENAQSGVAVAEAVRRKMDKLSVGSPPFSQAVIIKPYCTGDGDTDYYAKFIDDNNWSQDNGFSSAKNFIATRDDYGNLRTGTPNKNVDCANKEYVDIRIEASQQADIMIVNELTNNYYNKAQIDNLVGDIETALDSIIAIQEELIGGESE